MKKFNLDTPVLFIVFSRPDTTKLVFEEIRKARPKKLYIAADAPRENRPDEERRCAEVRKIVSKVDWPCEVHRLYQEKNLGCRLGESTAITWFFDNVEEGIILEDDNLPAPSFFKFCSELLEKYRYDDRVMMISGDNFQRNWKRDEYSYYFSRYTHIWGWASWRRAWKKYEIKTPLYPLIKEKGYMQDIYEHYFERKGMERSLDLTHYKNFDTWDYQWSFCIGINNGLVILPNENLITNIGIGPTATHTSGQFDREFELPKKDLKFPLKHPPFVIRDVRSDTRYFRWLLKKKFRNLFLRKTGLIKFFKIKN